MQPSGHTHRVTPLERAQIILEALVETSPERYAAALHFLCAIYGERSLRGTEAARLVLEGLAHEPAELENELRNHLQAILGCRAWPGDQHNVQTILGLLPNN